MDTPSTKPRSWDCLVQSARSASTPAEVDVHAAIRAEISAAPPQLQPASVFDDVLALFRSRWLQTGFAVLAFSAFFSCHQSLDVVNEIAWIWQLQGPVLAGI